MNKTLAMTLAVLCAGAPLSAQTRLPAFDFVRFSDVKAALGPAAAVPGAETPAIDALAAALSDPEAAMAEKLKAIEQVKSDDLLHFESWEGKLAPAAEMQILFSIKDILYSGAPSQDRFLALAVCGRFARHFRYAAAQAEAVDFLKELALRSSPNGQGQTLQAVFGLAEIAKAAPLKDLDFQYTERMVTAALDVLNTYGGGSVSDRVGQEQLYGLLILSNYLSYHLRNNALGNHSGDYMDRVDLMPAWPGGLAWRLEGTLIGPAERDLERLYSMPNTDFRGFLVATLIDLGRVTSMDYGTIERTRRLLRAMANHDEPNPKIRWMLAPYRR